MPAGRIVLRKNPANRQRNRVQFLPLDVAAGVRCGTGLEQANLQLSRAPKALPTLRINPAVKDIFAFRYEDFALEGYEPHPHIKAEVAV